MTWDDSSAGSTENEQLVYLSNLIGGDLSLVQPGGGNTSVKVEEEDGFGCRVRTLLVKGSGTDLRTITAGGFTHLYLERLALLKQKDSISDEEMMSLMRGCMLWPDRDPVPSVETPLHSLLPAKFVAHTHDVATLSLTDTPSAREHVRRVFGHNVAFLEYVRPGFPLAKRLAEMGNGKWEMGARALVMEKHGLCVWGETARECWETLREVTAKAEAFVAEAAQGKRVVGPGTDVGAQGLAPLRDDASRDLAAAILPAIRGELARSGWWCVLHLDDSPETQQAISRERFAEVAARGVMTPEHILRCGVKALVVELSAEQTPVGAQQRTNRHAITNGEPSVAAPLRPADRIRQAIKEYRDEYAGYTARHAVEPIPDYLKTIVILGLGIAYAGKDRRNALVAGDCYAATMHAMAGAEAVERYEFLSEDDAFEMEYWPLERRKIEESAKARKELDGKIALVIGAGSGTGRAAALLFASEGAHVVAADLKATAAEGVSAEINDRAPQRALGLGLDVADSGAVGDVVREAVLRFGGIDVLFYSPGIAPELHSVTEMPEEEIERQVAVHYRGAVAATREVSKVMLAQGTGGRLVYNASKSAFVPGEGAAAYGASKAALVHYVRNVAKELGREGITTNYINADAVDTPLFRNLLRQRAEAAGISEEEMLQRYADRAVFGTALVPPEAVAEAALWLASDRSAHTTGCVITVGGGAEGFPR